MKGKPGEDEAAEDVGQHVQDARPLHRKHGMIEHKMSLPLESSCVSLFDLFETKLLFSVPIKLNGAVAA